MTFAYLFNLSPTHPLAHAWTSHNTSFLSVLQTCQPYPFMSALFLFGLLPSYLCMARSLSFSSQFKCHLLRKIFTGHPVLRNSSHPNTPHHIIPFILDLFICLSLFFFLLFFLHFSPPFWIQFSSSWSIPF